MTIISVLVGGTLIAGGIIVYARHQSDSKPGPGLSVVRSWMAITLVVGLVVLSACAFAITDPSLRSTLLGGLTASAGGAIAFYFSSASADQARQDLISGIGNNGLAVPAVTGKTSADAQATLEAAGLNLVVDAAAPSANPAATVQAQQPPAGTQTSRGSMVVARF